MTPLQAGQRYSGEIGGEVARIDQRLALVGCDRKGENLSEAKPAAPARAFLWRAARAGSRDGKFAGTQGTHASRAAAHAGGRGERDVRARAGARRGDFG